MRYLTAAAFIVGVTMIIGCAREARLGRTEQLVPFVHPKAVVKVTFTPQAGNVRGKCDWSIPVAKNLSLSGLRYKGSAVHNDIGIAYQYIGKTDGIGVDAATGCSETADVYVFRMPHLPQEPMEVVPIVYTGGTQVVFETDELKVWIEETAE